MKLIATFLLHEHPAHICCWIQFWAEPAASGVQEFGLENDP